MRRVTDLTEDTPNKKAKTPGKAKATPKAETNSSTATQDDEVVNLGGVSILCAARCRWGSRSARAAHSLPLALSQAAAAQRRPRCYAKIRVILAWPCVLWQMTMRRSCC